MGLLADEAGTADAQVPDWRAKELADEARKLTVAEDVAMVSDKWFPIVEAKLPMEGFVHGLTFPTAADLAVLNMIKGFMPFGAAYRIGGYDVSVKYPKLAAHAVHVAKDPH